MTHDRTESTQVNGIEMHYLDAGTGDALLLLHGFTGRGGDWEHVFELDSLARRYRLIVPDLRGHGRSTNPTGTFTQRACAADVLALLDRLGVRSFRGIGLSLGGNTLLHAATMEPDRIEAMVLVAATTHYPEAARGLMRAMGQAEHSEEEWRLMRSQHVRGDDQIRALWGHMVAFADDRDDMAFGPAELARIRARTLIVTGDHDPLYGLEPSMALRSGIDHSALWIIPGGGHAPIFGSWREEFARRAIDFVDGRLPE
jgi:pimeloyl-ACP methyl ester carboxylesterase